MCETSSVTEWIDRLKDRDADAAGRIWARYVDRMVRLAKGKLGRTPRAAADEEDVVQSAFNSFVCAAQQGRFSRLHDRADLWQVLVTLTERKAINQRRRELAQKRGGGKLVARSAVRDAAAVDPEPSPELAAQMAEKLQVMLSKLADDQLRDIALAKLE